MNRSHLAATLCLGVLAMLLGGQAQPANEDDPIARLDAALERGNPRDRAVRVIVAMSTDRNPMLRSNAIEAMQPLPERALPLTQAGLDDGHPAVRYAAVVTAGMKDFRSLNDAIRPLLGDENPSVRSAARYALHRLGEEVDLTPLAGALRSADPGLRANTAQLLGLIGDASAVPMLKEAAAEPMPRVGAAQANVVRMQIAEAIVRLGDDSELSTLRAGAWNSVGEVRVVAINAMGAVGDRKMIPAFEQMLTDRFQPEPPEIRLAAAGALARMGQYAGQAVAMKLSRDANPIVRSQAAWVLGWFADGPSLGRLGQMLDDETPVVRIAAAASIIRRSAEGPTEAAD
jgi:HEAT repeat protein